mmetsp:Transcript_104613/g.197010  ORF Transcript_104613/g.197010 Transcript_104613/m.197010 type:complete len:524 (-) Transcript_104613:54-1625(-)
MPGSRRNSRSGSQPGTPRARSLDVTLDPRGEEAKYSRRSKSGARGLSAPPTPSSAYRSARSQSGSPKASRKNTVNRGVKMGYDHPGAQTSASDLLHMEPTWVPVTERTDPWQNVAAGVRSDRMAEISRCDIEDHHHTEIPVYAPPFRSDPISHRQYPCDKHLRDETKVKGAAGVRTDRLTFLRMNWITQHLDPAKRAHDHALDYVYEKTDPISHVAPPPNPLTTGIRRFEGAHDHSKVPLFHMGASPPRLAQKEWHERIKSKEVRTGAGDIIYNVAGEEDMIPPATNRHTKADLPPTPRHKYENDRDTLPPFFRLRHNNRQSPTLGQSEDMYYSMYGDKRAESMMEKAKDKPLSDFEAMVSTMLGGKRPSPSDLDRFAGYVTDRAMELRRFSGGKRPSQTEMDAGYITDRTMLKRRPSDTGSPKKSGSPAMPYPVAAQTYREATGTQRRQSDTSGRTRKAQSVDVYSRRSRTGGSVAGSDVASMVSVDSQTRGFEYSPKSARTRRAQSTDDYFRRSTTAGSDW